jgi:type IV pilus assembly protein PilA
MRVTSKRDGLCRGFSLIELLIVISIILSLAAIAIPNAHKQLMLAHEQAAIQEITTIHKAETQYQAIYGRYAQSLAELGPPATGADGAAAANIIPKGLADGTKSGYIFTLAGSPTGYSISAVPEAFGKTAGRTFFSDQTMVIRQNVTAEPASVSSPELK